MKLVLVTLVLALCIRPAVADEMDGAYTTFTNAVDTVLGHVRDGSMDIAAKRKAILGVIEPLFDFSLMGKLTLGKQQWSAMTPEQRDEFIALFTERLKESYLDKIELFTDGEVQYEPPEKGDNKILVTTLVRSKADSVKVAYRIYRKGAQAWLGYDFEIEGVSMVSSYRSQYAQVLKGAGVEGLLAKMREKVADE